MGLDESVDVEVRVEVVLAVAPAVVLVEVVEAEDVEEEVVLVGAAASPVGGMACRRTVLNSSAIRC